MDKDSVIHFVAGGLGGSFAAVVINPLEVVKTRRQSSKFSMHTNQSINSNPPFSDNSSAKQPPTHQPKDGPARCSTTKITPLNQMRTPWNIQQASKFTSGGIQTVKMPSVYRQLCNIVKKEGILALWKGLGTTLVGVFPARAIYFGAYSNAKTMLNKVLEPESPGVHMLSAASAGFCCTTITNPLWMVRTRLQLDSRKPGKKMTVNACMNTVYKEFGLKGFYRGVTASYLGIGETMIHFVIYERLKRSSFLSRADARGEQYPGLGTAQYIRLVICASISRMIAASIGYPHEVLRTRLREENSKYNGLWRTGRLIMQQEGWRALYNGLSVHLLRTVPNTALTMATYELLVSAFLKYSDSHARSIAN